jgi:hypothetical protein
MSRKNGRREYMSRTSSDGMSVVTQRSRQCLVTKSRRASGVEKCRTLVARVGWEVSGPSPFIRPAIPSTTDSVEASSLVALASERRYSWVKPWWSTKYRAMVRLPAQMPGNQCQKEVEI